MLLREEAELSQYEYRIQSGGSQLGGDWPSQGTRLPEPFFRADGPTALILRHRITGRWSWNKG